MTEILPIGVTHLHDIPTLLRNLANEIENRVHGDLVAGAATFLCANGEVFVCGWGRTDDVHSIGLLQLGAAWLAANRTAR